LVQEPPLGEVRTAEVGDTLVRTARVTQAAGLKVYEPVTLKGEGMAKGNTIIVPASILVQRFRDGTYTCYMSPETLTFSNFMASGPADAGICVDDANPSFTKGIAVAGGANAYYKPTVAPRIEKTTYIDKKAPGFSQELIYNGKSGNSVKFLYREFASEMARPAFDQEVTYDLNEGTTVGFKGSRVEVVEASNTQIRYKVLQHFPVKEGQ
jgi:hypothetical protein